MHVDSINILLDHRSSTATAGACWPGGLKLENEPKKTDKFPHHCIEKGYTDKGTTTHDTPTRYINHNAAFSKAKQTKKHVRAIVSTSSRDKYNHKSNRSARRTCQFLFGETEVGNDQDHQQVRETI